jgi:transposase-like protein
MNTTSIILKRDTRGRVRTPVERQRAVVAEFERSGLSAMKFAALVGVRYNTLWTWLQKHRKGGRPSGRKRARPQRFVELAVAPSAESRGAAGGDGGVHIVLPGGASLRVSHRSQVELAAQLLKALGASC